MLIQIGVDELLGDYKKPFGLNLIKSLSIDYATNSIHGWLEDEEVIVFKFRACITKKTFLFYGFRNSFW